MKIKTKLRLTYSILVVLLIGVIGVNFATYNDLASDANFINSSGRLRALSFKMSQLANHIAFENHMHDKEPMKEKMALFEDTIKNIEKGNESLGLEELKHKETKERLQDVKQIWEKEFRPSYESILSSQDLQSLEFINENVDSYVKSLDELVTGYSSYSKSKVVNARYVNIAFLIISVIFAAVSVIYLNKGIIITIGNMAKDLKELSEGNGDLTKRIEIRKNDEIGELTKYINIFIEDVHEIVKDIARMSGIISSDLDSITNTTEEISRANETIAFASQEVSQGSVDQDQKLYELNNLVSELQERLMIVDQKSNIMLEYSKQTEESATGGNDFVNIQSDQLKDFIASIEDASGVVSDLNRYSKNIKEIVELIQNISSQTNLLALNASIEAARAGEHGRGFAVVAEEIRKLAVETDSSASQISKLIGTIGDKTENVNMTMTQLVFNIHTQETFMEDLKGQIQDILERSKTSFEESKEIAQIAQSVSDEFLNVNESAGYIREISRRNSENTQETASSIEEQTASFEEVSANIASLSELSDNLKRIVNNFKI